MSPVLWELRILRNHHVKRSGGDMSWGRADKRPSSRVDGRGWETSDGRRGVRTYGLSVQVKTWSKPQERTSFSGDMAFCPVMLFGGP